MGDRKSRVDIRFYIDLFRNVLRDAYSFYPEIPHTEFTRDMNYVETRVRCEGIKFFTVQLPSLGKAIDRALELGKLDVPMGFRIKSKAGSSQNIPSLFSALFLSVFTSEGAFRHEPKTAVPQLRQLCFLFYKVEVPFTDAAVSTACSKFVDIDASLVPLTRDLKDRPAFKYARLILARLFRGFDPSAITPRHGPGAVAEKCHGRTKYDFRTYDPDIDRLYPYVNFITFGVLAQTVDSLTRHLGFEGMLPPSRVCFVPKDSRGPRTIAAEPALLQYLQQGLGRAVVDLVEGHPLTKRRVFFTDQQVHRDLALAASRNRKHATLDLKDASDRVSLDLVENLFPEFLLPYFRALRSKRAILPDGRIVELRKFAPMGSALCFPIEALVFFALASGYVWSENRRRASNPQPVFVYGDDLIVPTRYASGVITELEQYGVLFNQDKCCIKGNFRESCGMDALFGENITPLKFRSLILEAPHLRRTNLVTLNENANAFFDKGYWYSARFLDDYVETHWGSIPTADWRFSGLARKSRVLPLRLHIPPGVVAKWDRNLQELKVRTLCEKSRTRTELFPSSVSRLGHNLLNGVSQPYSDEVAVAHSAINKVVWRVV